MEILLSLSTVIPLPVAITIVELAGPLASLKFLIDLSLHLTVNFFTNIQWPDIFLIWQFVELTAVYANGFLANSSRYKIFNQLTVGSINDTSGKFFL